MAKIIYRLSTWSSHNSYQLKSHDNKWFNCLFNSLKISRSSLRVAGLQINQQFKFWYPRHSSQLRHYRPINPPSVSPFITAMEERRVVSFKVLGDGDPNNTRPRRGRLSVKDRRDLETPNFIAISSRGVVPHMTPDVIMASSQIGGVHLALEDCKTLVPHVLVLN